MTLIAVLLLSLQASASDPATSAAAVAVCQSKMAGGACSVEWRGASLEILKSGSGNITVTSKGGQRLRWAFDCHNDLVEGTRACSLQGGTNESISISRIFLRQGGLTNGVTWGGSKFPGSEKIAKIGSLAPMRWDADQTIYGPQAIRVIEAARRGGPAIFRWYDWPEQKPNDIEVNFDGFAVVWDLFKAAIEHREKL